MPKGVFLFEIELGPLRLGGIPKFEALSKFPAIRRDFALLVDRDLPYQAVLDCVLDTAPLYWNQCRFQYKKPRFELDFTGIFSHSY